MAVDRAHVLTSEQFREVGDTVNAVKAMSRSEAGGDRRFPAPFATLAYAVCATEDWTAFGAVTCKIRSGDTLTDTELECVAPGNDGTDLAGTRGLAILFAGENGAEYQFLPLECEPSCDLGA